MSVAFGLRLINLAEPYRADEVLSLDIVLAYQDRPLADMVRYVQAIEVHPPLYYLVLRWWGRLFSYDETVLRLLSVFAGTAIVALTYWLALLIFQYRRPIAAIAAGMVAVLPMQIEFSQEARPYALFSVAVLIAAGSLWQILHKHPRLHWWTAAYTASLLIGAYLHYSVLIFIGSFALLWLGYLFLYEPRAYGEYRRWFLVHAAIALGLWPQWQWLLYKLVTLGSYQLYDMSRTFSAGNGREISFMESALHQLIWATSHRPVTQFEVFVVAIFKITLSIAAAVSLLRWRERIMQQKVYWQQAAFFIGWVIVVPLTAFLFSPYSESYRGSYESHVLPISVFIAVLGAGIIGSQQQARYRVALLALYGASIMTFTAGMLGDDSLWDTDHRMPAVAQVINERAQPGDIVLVASSYMRSDVAHYVDESIPVVALFPLQLADKRFDIFSSRRTLGLVENETMLRNRTFFDPKYPSIKEPLDLKMHYIMETYHSQRIWTVLLQDDTNLELWLLGSDWRKDLGSDSDLMPVQLYVPE